MSATETPATCGEGLAAHAPLPEKLGEIMAATAAVLEAHTRALDPSDDHGKHEHDAYTDLVDRHRGLATELARLAERMRGYRELPVAEHDMAKLLDKTALEAFETFVKLERELKELLEARLEEDQKMLIEMVAAIAEQGKS